VVALEHTSPVKFFVPGNRANLHERIAGQDQRRGFSRSGQRRILMD
jgi:hypothetical protein